MVSLFGNNTQLLDGGGQFCKFAGGVSRHSDVAERALFRCCSLTLDKSLVFVVPADPEPVETLSVAERERPERLGDSNRPEITHRLQVERWVGRVLAEQCELFVRLSLNVCR